MKTILDEFHTSFLHAVAYTKGVLRIIVSEGFRSAEPEEPTSSAHTVMYSLNTSKESRLVEVLFNRPISWQLVNESFTAGDDYEVREDKFALQVLTQSRYLDYVRTNHGWFEDAGNPSSKHLRVWTENEVIDVVSCEAPTVKQYEASEQ